MRKYLRDLIIELSWILQYKHLSSDPHAPIVRVLNFHNIAPKDFSLFADFIEELGKEWSFISPPLFESYLNNNNVDNHRNLLLTFDDGFASNYYVNSLILNPIGVYSLLFIVPDFLDLNCRDSVYNNIFPFGPPSDIGRYDLSPVTWQQLRDLQTAGNLIGSHSLSHKRLSLLSSDNLVYDIRTAKSKIESQLMAPIEHFAIPFGNLGSFNTSSLSIISGYHKYIYTTLRGCNKSNSNPVKVILRDTSSSLSMTRPDVLMLRGSADFIYRSARKTFKAYL